MLHYRPNLKDKARQLRSNLTESERVLWSRLRGKQLLGMQFYRQKPIQNYIVDFFAPKVKLVIEVDGSQHRKEDESQKDKIRDKSLAALGLTVMRFDSNAVLNETNAVADAIYNRIADFLNSQIPLNPPFSKGD